MADRARGRGRDNARMTSGIGPPPRSPSPGPGRGLQGPARGFQGPGMRPRGNRRNIRGGGPRRSRSPNFSGRPPGTTNSPFAGYRDNRRANQAPIDLTEEEEVANDDDVVMTGSNELPGVRRPPRTQTNQVRANHPVQRGADKRKNEDQTGIDVVNRSNLPRPVVSVTVVPTPNNLDGTRGRRELLNDVPSMWWNQLGQQQTDPTSSHCHQCRKDGFNGCNLRRTLYPCTRCFKLQQGPYPDLVCRNGASEIKWEAARRAEDEEAMRGGVAVPTPARRRTLAEQREEIFEEKSSLSELLESVIKQSKRSKPKNPGLGVGVSNQGFRLKDVGIPRRNGQAISDEVRAIEAQALNGGVPGILHPSGLAPGSLAADIEFRRQNERFQAPGGNMTGSASSGNAPPWRDAEQEVRNTVNQAIRADRDNRPGQRLGRDRSASPPRDRRPSPSGLCCDPCAMNDRRCDGYRPCSACIRANPGPGPPICYEDPPGLAAFLRANPNAGNSGRRTSPAIQRRPQASARAPSVPPAQVMSRAERAELSLYLYRRPPRKCGPCHQRGLPCEVMIMPCMECRLEERDCYEIDKAFVGQRPISPLPRPAFFPQAAPPRQRALQQAIDESPLSQFPRPAFFPRPAPPASQPTPQQLNFQQPALQQTGDQSPSSQFPRPPFFSQPTPRQQQPPTPPQPSPPEPSPEPALEQPSPSIAAAIWSRLNSLQDEAQDVNDQMIEQDQDVIDEMDWESLGGAYAPDMDFQPDGGFSPIAPAPGPPLNLALPQVQPYRDDRHAFPDPRPGLGIGGNVEGDNRPYWEADRSKAIWDDFLAMRSRPAPDVEQRFDLLPVAFGQVAVPIPYHANNLYPQPADDVLVLSVRPTGLNTRFTAANRPLDHWATYIYDRGDGAFNNAQESTGFFQWPFRGIERIADSHVHNPDEGLSNEKTCKEQAYKGDNIYNITVDLDLCSKVPTKACEVLPSSGIDASHEYRPWFTCSDCRGGQLRFYAAAHQALVDKTKMYLCRSCAMKARTQNVAWQGLCLCMASLQARWMCHEHRQLILHSSYMDPIVIRSEEFLIRSGILFTGQQTRCTGCYEQAADPASSVWSCKLCREYVYE